MSDKKEKTARRYGLVGTIVFAFVIIFFAVINLLNLSDYYQYIVLGLGLFVIVYGIIRIALYFKRCEYKSITNFGFSIGIFSLIIGACICLNGAKLISYFPVITGVIVAGFGAIMLQHAAAMQVLSQKGWGLSLIYSLYSIFVGIIILFDLFDFVSKLDIRFHCFVIVASVMYILSILTNFAALKKYAKLEEAKVTEDIRPESEPSAATVTDNVREESKGE